VKNEAKKHGISASFPKAVTGDGDALVIQYEIKLEKAHNCGGMCVRHPVARRPGTPCSLYVPQDSC
jgi:hypothetical protein